ncbi:aminotransferase class V-fold PLP-dependent enzyme [Paraburkholderia sediminicola]|uniref:aminotransferase class V-fold PLP-dependent enzyme n=1 Tax=Paraburkholderia sediminicola TaxID=458836 RepID=UPI0038BAFCB9
MMATNTAQTFKAFREQYQGTKNWVYMDASARGLLSNGVRNALAEYVDHRANNGGDKDWMFSMAELSRQRFASLIGADVDEVSLTKNVTEGINAFAFSLPWREGDNVVVCPDIEHPANIFPWYHLARQKGIEVKAISAENGRVPLEKLAAAIDHRTRVVTVSAVSFAPGFRAPLRELSKLCRAKNALLLVDAAQTVGVLHTDVDDLGIDGLAVATQKGLLGLYGMGFLYVRKEVAESMKPVYISRMGIQLAEAHEAAVGDPSAFTFAKGARRFDLGNFNFIGAVAVAQSISELEAVGSINIEQYVTSLAQRLATGIAELGLPVFGGAEAKDRAHIVSIGSAIGDGHDSTDDAVLSGLSAALLNNNVRHTIRRGFVRLSLHAYNNDDDVDQVVAISRDFVKSRKVAERV